MAKLISSLVGEHGRPHMEAAVNVRFGSWLCKNATALRWRGISIPRSVISRRRNFVGLFGAINFGKLFSSSLDFSSFHTARVKKRRLTLGLRLRVYSYQRTSPDRHDRSGSCHNRKLPCARR
jgi:hypothetical protein